MTSLDEQINAQTDVVLTGRCGLDEALSAVEVWIDQHGVTDQGLTLIDGDGRTQQWSTETPGRMARDEILVRDGDGQVFAAVATDLDRLYAALLPESVVRARTVPDPNADYRSYVRSTTCQDGRFSFSGLPSGGWFVIAPVSAGGDDRVVLMRHVTTRNGRVSITL